MPRKREIGVKQITPRFLPLLQDAMDYQEYKQKKLTHVCLSNEIPDIK